jgi:hypothetical protein
MHFAVGGLVTANGLLCVRFAVVAEQASVRQEAF